ncbi:MAG: hypothetical protein MZV65_28640 [Chromatiales bacterium]|nr:hypothetical protein [Chromatiales bacterium]
MKVGIWSGDTPPTQYSDPLNFTKIELTAPTQEKEELISNMTSNFGSPLDSQNKPTEGASTSMEFNTFTPAMLATVLGADVSEKTQAEAAVTTPETVTTALGVWVPLANSHIAPHSVATPIELKTTGGSPVTVANTKYEIDPVLGMIKATHSDAVGAMTITYTKAARTWEEYAAGQAKSVYVHLVGQATDQVSGRVGRLDVWKASLAPSGSVDPVVGGYFTGALEGTLIAPTGRASPWQWQAVTA